MKLAQLSFLLAILSIPTEAACQEAAVVKIYAITHSGSSQGTGFFSTDHGQVITAYHVIEGARKITISNEQLGTFSDILVAYISPTRDIALLSIRNSGTTPYFNRSNSPPKTTDVLEAQGFPLGAPRQLFRARTTRNTFLRSTTLSDQSGKRLFNNDLPIDIIPLDMTIYSGMSGGPVLDDGRVVGILSGSYQEGGSIAWAIPCKYLSGELEEINKKPNEVSWPPITLMSSAWKTLRGAVRLNSKAAASYDEYIDNVESQARAFDELFHQAQVTQRDILFFRPIFERVATGGSGAEDPQAARKTLTHSQEVLGASIMKFADLANLASTSGQAAIEALNKVTIWLAEESNLDEPAGWKFADKLQAIQEQHKDLLVGMNAYLGIDEAALEASAPDLAVALSASSGSPKDDAAAWLKIIDTFEPVVQAYGSFKALTFMNESTGMLRQVGELYEPIVYQTAANH